MRLHETASHKMLFEMLDRLEREKKITLQDRERFNNAHQKASLSHFNQSRLTGERFIAHGERTCIILIENGFYQSIHLVLGVTHDIVEDAPEQLIKTFLRQMFERARSDPWWHEVYWGTLQLSRLHYSSPIATPVQKTDKQYYEQMTLRSAFVVKLGERLDNFNTCETMSVDKIIKLIAETRTFLLEKAERYAPRLAAKLIYRMGEIERSIRLNQPPPRTTPGSFPAVNPGTK